jgi:hypothetical protein
MSASLTDTGWLLDDISARTAEDSFFSSYDCKTSHKFPCAATAFPDAKVSGRITVYPNGAAANYAKPSGVVLDGFGVRVFDAKTKALKYTELMLSDTAFEPHFLAGEDLVQKDNGSEPVLRLRIAPDGKSATLAYVANAPELDATPGLTIDTGTPNRARGHLKLDVKDVAQFDVTFDVGTQSECFVGEDYRCGNTP